MQLKEQMDIFALISLMQIYISCKITHRHTELLEVCVFYYLFFYYLTYFQVSQ